MKTKAITLFCLFLSVYIKAQAGIDIYNLGTDAILQFGTEARGIKLTPVADATATISVAGTVVFDGNTGSFRYFNGSWSVADAGGLAPGTGVPAAADNKTQGTIIGSKTSAANGVLILESPNKALVLPNVDFPVFSIPSPQVGLMVYNKQNGTLDVFNGNNWMSY